MKIAVGTESKLKLRAVSASLKLLGINGEVIGHNSKSLVPNAPVGYEEMTLGALNRAKEALRKVNESQIGIGIENGLLQVVETSEWFDLPVICVLTKDGDKFFSIGAGYNVPQWMIDRIFNEHTELGFIIQELDKDAEKDPINYFTKGLLRREEILTQALICALSNIVNKERYFKV